mmetsp:Transcript_13640/g.22343  ORF Transcript_13640/g.22343 Transcript_13640/m.22343 type:complete len:213 (-) Transcript_13640:87-725(-)
MEASPPAAAALAPLLFFRSSENDTFFSFVPPDVVVVAGVFPMMTSFPTTETPGGGVIFDNCFPFPLLAPLAPPTTVTFVVADVGVVVDIVLEFSVGSIFPVLLLLLLLAVAVGGPPFPPPFNVVVVPFIIVEDEDASLFSLSLGVSTVSPSPSNGIEYQFDPNKKEASPSHPLLEDPPSIIIFCPRSNFACSCCNCCVVVDPTAPLEEDCNC